jgi:hypothetical protein
MKIFGLNIEVKRIRKQKPFDIWLEGERLRLIAKGLEKIKEINSSCWDGVSEPGSPTNIPLFTTVPNSILDRVCEDIRLDNEQRLRRIQMKEMG